MRNTLVIAITLLLLIACKSKALQPVTKQDAIAFSEKIEKSIKNGNGAALDSSIEIDMLTDEVMKIAGNKGKASLKTALKKGFTDKKFGNQLITNMGDDGTYEFVRAYEKGGETHAIFRLYGNVGLNYHDLNLVKYNDKVYIKDMYVYTTGENISTSMAHTYNSAMLKNDKTVNDLRNLFHQKEYATAKKAYESLPASVKKEKLVQIIYLNIASEIDTETYTKALTEFEKIYGDDPTVPLIMLDVHFMKKDFNEALKDIDKIDATVQDPFLDYYRGLIYNQLGNAAQSTAMLERLYKNKPAFEDGIVELISNYINDKEYKRADTLINTYKRNAGFDQEKLSNVRDLYPDDDNNVNW